MTRIGEFVLETIAAMSCLVGKGHLSQALVLLYSAIDTLAWSSRPDGDVTRQDFCSWVDAHMNPASLGCSAEDLYSARCGLLHSGSAGSRLSREGKATELWYATSSAELPSVQASLSRRGISAKVIGIVELVEAFGSGATHFLEDLSEDAVREQQVNQRIKLWLGFIPTKRLVGDGA